MNNLSELLELTKTRYIELGGVLEEGEKESLASQQEDEGCVCMCVCDCLFEFSWLHISEITRLKTLLELEREKREELERETDELRQKLHQASIGLINHQLSTEV